MRCSNATNANTRLMPRGATERRPGHNPLPLHTPGGNFVSKTASFWTAAATAALMAVPAAAQQPPSTEHVRALVQQALAQTQATQPPATPEVPFTTAGPRVTLTV